MKQEKILPRITNRKPVAKSRLFAIEQIDLTFSNGATREYERMMGGGRGAVMVIPMLDDETILLIREYCAGTHSYELGFPKGLIDLGENSKQAANREMQEEIGYGANNFTFLHQVSIAPAILNSQMDIYLAKDLYESRLEGDEPEPLEVVKWKLSDYQALLAREEFNEARNIAALMLALELQRNANE